MLTAILATMIATAPTPTPTTDQLDACFSAAITGQLRQCQSRETLRNICLPGPDTGLPLPDSCLVFIVPGEGA